MLLFIECFLILWRYRCRADAAIQIHQ